VRIILKCAGIPASRLCAKAGTDADALAPESDEVGILFRVPTLLDLKRMYRRLPVLPEASGAEEGEPEIARVVSSPPVAAPEGADPIERLTELLVACALLPRLIPDNPVQIPVGCYPLAEIDATEVVRLFEALQKAAGYTQEAAEAIRPLPPTGGVSPTSTPSASDTDGARASTSAN